MAGSAGSRESRPEALSYNLVEAKRHQVVGRLLTVASACKGILSATVLLFLFSWILQPQSVSSAALSGMLPFAGVLIFVAMGQTLVVQQRGIDLSVPGIVSLSIVIVSYYSHDHGGSLLGLLIVVIAALLAALIAGLVNGLLISKASVAPIVATLGLNAILFGFDVEISGGTPVAVAANLSSFANTKIGGVTLVFILSIVAVYMLTFVLKRSVFGRRFEAVGSNARVARAAGVMPGYYQMTAYGAAGLLYGVGGVLLAGLVQMPNAFEGNNYLLPSIASVVLGGTSLLGGKGNLFGTAIASLFLMQLQLVVQTTGSSIWVQYVFQGAAIIVGVGVYSINVDRLRKRKRQSTS